MAPVTKTYPSDVKTFSSSPRHDAATFRAMASAPTTNDDFDEGAWLALHGDVELHVSNPNSGKKNANRPVHYFADENRMSLCGCNYAPDSYQEVHETTIASEHRCRICQLMLDAADQPDPLLIGSVQTLKGRYSRRDFLHLIRSNDMLAVGLNRIKSIDSDLYLMVDLGFTSTRSMKAILPDSLRGLQFITVVWPEDVTDEDVAELVEQTREESAQSLADLESELDPALYEPTGYDEFRGALFKALGGPGLRFAMHSFAQDSELSLCGEVFALPQDPVSELPAHPEDQVPTQPPAGVCPACWALVAGDTTSVRAKRYPDGPQTRTQRRSKTLARLAKDLEAGVDRLDDQLIGTTALLKAVDLQNEDKDFPGFLTRVVYDHDLARLNLFVDRSSGQRTSNRRVKNVLEALPRSVDDYRIDHFKVITA